MESQAAGADLVEHQLPVGTRGLIERGLGNRGDALLKGIERGEFCIDAAGCEVFELGVVLVIAGNGSRSWLVWVIDLVEVLVRHALELLLSVLSFGECGSGKSHAGSKGEQSHEFRHDSSCKNLCGYSIGSKLLEEIPNLQQNFVRPCGSEREFQNALRGELRATLGVLCDKAHEVLRIDACIRGEADLQFGALAINLGNAHTFALEAQRGGFEKVDG